MERIKEGTIIYLNTGVSIAEKCEVIPIKDEELDNLILEGMNNIEDIYKVHSLDLLGTFYIDSKDIFITKEDAIEAYKQEYEQQVEEYLDEINSLLDLLYFPLEHCINGDENTDYAAKAAYCIKIKESI